MAGDNPALIVRVAANVDELRKNLTEGTAHIDTMVTAAIGLQTKLVLAESAAAAAGTSMRTLADAIAKSGTATEAQVAALTKATAEFLALKGAVGAAKDQLAALKPAADASGAAVGSLRGALGEFDGVLAAMGVHMGPEIRGLGELGDAAGKTTAQLGLIATAGLMVGAALGGWKIGRLIADFFDLDTTIGHATAKLLGWGDAAGQAAGATADVLARASRTAGYAVTDLTIAMGINEAALGTWRSNADISAAAVKGWQGEIAKVQSAGDFASLTADLKSQNFSLQDLAARYHLSVAALQFFQREQAASAKAVVEANAIIETSNKSKLHALAEELAAHKEAAKIEAAAILTVTKLQEEYYELVVQHGGTANAIAIAGIEKWAAETTAAAVKAKTDTQDFYDSLAAVSKEKMAGVGVDWDLFKNKSIPALQETADNALKTYNAMVVSGAFFREALDQQLDKYHQLQDAARGYGDSGVDAANRIAAAEKKKDDAKQAALAAQAAALKNLEMGNTYDIGHAARDPEIMKLLHDGWSLENAEALNLARQWGFQAKTYDKLGNLETTPSKAERVPGYEAGGPTVPGLSMLHGGEYVVPKAGALVSSGSGAPQVIHLVVDGRVLASIVNDHNTKTMRQSRQWPSA